MRDIGELADLCTPWCVHVVATLGIADHIASGLERVEDLAQAANCDAQVLGSVLAHLAEQGVFEHPTPGRFVLNDTARALLDPMSNLGMNLDGFGGRMAGAWSTLLQYVRTGKPAYDGVFGLPFWDDLNAHPQIGAQFDDLMGPAGHGVPDPHFAITGGWESVKTVVDVGGGTGAMVAEILRVRPWIRGTLIDFARTVARAPVMDRLTILGQSFFDPLPPGADLYLLRKVINDWPDREAIAILRRCREAAAPNGRVAVLRSVSTDGSPPWPISIESVLLGGKRRSLEGFRALALDAGLEVVAFDGSCVECRPLS